MSIVEKCIIIIVVGVVVQSILSSWDYNLINPGSSWTNFTIYIFIFVFGHLSEIQYWICDWR